MVIVRSEKEGDFAAIRDINLRAFEQEDEAALVEALRESSFFVPELPLVAIVDDETAGHIMFTRSRIQTSHEKFPALTLAPMAVLPEYQNQGIGSKLVDEGLNESRRLGYRIVTVVGHPEYYSRFGFIPAGAAVLQCPFPVPDEAFMVLELTARALNGISGMVVYHPEFGATDTGSGAGSSSGPFSPGSWRYWRILRRSGWLLPPGLHLYPPSS
jgi:putative acetyltransferase